MIGGTVDDGNLWAPFMLRRNLWAPFMLRRNLWAPSMLRRKAL
ncbi:MAG TPA: hypothetical protein VFS43_44525 [Polyangiaceae bacterium]|nr:hypothetical protein [Polyangiaceae bacterium]